MYSQDSKLDSLSKVLLTQSEDTNKVNTLNQIGIEIIYTTGEFEKTIENCQKAVLLAEKTNFLKGKAKALKTIGAAYMYQGKFKEAIISFEQSKSVYIAIDDKKGQSACYNNIGLVYWNQGEYTKALKSYKATSEIEELLNDKSGLAGTYNNMALVYEDLGNYSLALDYHYKGLRIKEELDDKTAIATSFINIGAVYEHQKKYDEAIKNYYYSYIISNEIENKRLTGISISNIGNVFVIKKQYSQAKKCYLEAINIFILTGNKSGEGSVYNALGTLYHQMGDEATDIEKNYYYKLSLDNYFNSLMIEMEIGEQKGLTSTYTRIGKLQIQLKNYKEAREYLIDGLEMAQTIGNKEYIKESYLALSQLDSIEQNFQNAYLNYKFYIAYRDSMSNEETAQKSLISKMQYELDKEEAWIRQEEERKKNEIKRRNSLQYSLIMIAIFIIFGFILLAGFIKLPIWAIRILNFIFLLLTFEAILVFLDPYLDKITNDVPLYSLIANFLIAMCIFPVHAFIESKLKKRLGNK